MRLVIHAGFGKCGSSAIQHALAAGQSALRKQSVFLFGKDLSINYRAPPADAPFWAVQAFFRDRGNRETVGPQLRRELTRLSSTTPDGTAVLSAEILAEPDLARRFARIDDLCETTVIFYIRPQYEWIPSAWKQWELKSGIALDDFVERCLKSDAPGFLRKIDAWAAALPRAKIVVRILAQALAESESPGNDFFRILGLGAGAGRIGNRRVNPSPDFALLHILNKNPWLFRSHDDNEPFKALTRVLPERHLSTNIKMLRLEDEQRIADHFAADNIAVLTKYCGLTGAAVDETCNAYFRPRVAGRAYSDVSEIEIINRGLGILLENLMNRSGGKPIFRPPYWKIPRRIATRLRQKR